MPHSLVYLMFMCILGLVFFISSYLIGYGFCHFLGLAKPERQVQNLAYSSLIGTFALTALLYLSLFDLELQLTSLIITLSIFAYSIKNSAWSILKQLTSSSNGLNLVLLAICAATYISIKYHGPIMGTDGLHYGDQNWYASHAYALIVNPLTMPDLSYIDATHVFARSAVVIWSAAIDNILNVGTSAFFSTTTLVFSALWLAAALRSIVIHYDFFKSSQHHNIWLFILVICLGSFIFNLVIIDSPPATLIIPITFALFALLKDQQSGLVQFLSIAICILIMSYLSKVFIFAFAAPLIFLAGFNKTLKNFGFMPALIITGISSLALLSYLAYMLWQYEGFLHLVKIPEFSISSVLGTLKSPQNTMSFIISSFPVFLSVLMFRFLAIGDKTEKIVSLGFLILVPLYLIQTNWFWVSISSAMLTVCFTLLSSRNEYKIGRFEILFLHLTFLAFMFRSSLHYVGSMHEIVALLIILNILLGSFLFTKKCSINLIVALVNSALIIGTHLIINLNAGLSEITTYVLFLCSMFSFVFFLISIEPQTKWQNHWMFRKRIFSYVSVVGIFLILVAFTTFDRLACGFRMHTVCPSNMKDWKYDMWRQLRQNSRAGDIVFTSLVGKDFVGGYDYTNAIAQRQFYLSAWVTNPDLRGNSEKVADLLSKNKMILSGEITPDELLSRAPNETNYFAVVKREDKVPANFEPVYSNQLLSLYRIK